MDTLVAVLSILGILMIGVMSPGPSFLFIAQRALGHSRSDGILASVGMGVGGVIFAILVLTGIHVLLTAVPVAYAVLKGLGGAYLLYLAWRIARGAKRPLVVQSSGKSGSLSRGRSFALGLTTQLSNPKTMIVYATVFSGLLPAHFDLNFVALLVPGIFTIEFSWYCFVAVALSAERPRRVYVRFKSTLDRSAAGLLGLLGLKVLWDSTTGTGIRA